MKENFQQFIDRALAHAPSVSQTPEYEIHHEPILEAFDRGQMLRRLNKRPESECDKPNSLHIGVAGFHNFDVVTITRPRRMLLLDVNPAQERFWKTVVRLLRQHEDPESFKEAFQALRVKGAMQCEDTTVPDREYSDIKRYMQDASWLNETEKYAYLHRMAKEGNIAATTIDLVHDFNRAEVLGDALSKEGLKTDTCYWANIAAFFRPHRGGGYMSRNDSVFGEKPRHGDGPGTLTYPVYSYCDRRNRVDKTNKLWTDQEMRDAQVYHPETLPAMEQFLRIISAVGGEHGEHYLLESINRPYREMLVYDGPPTRLPAQERSWRERMIAGDNASGPILP